MSRAFPLHRNVAALQTRRFDLLVIGGGIYGAWTAYDAALRGLSVALVERVDWASGTSSASSKLIHGGLRYLEHFEFGLVRHALTERRTLARIAPHLVRPLNFVLPLQPGARVGALQLGAGLMLYDLLAFGRQPVQRHKRYPAERLRRRYPFLTPGLRGGFRYGDCQEDDARLTLVVAAAAQSAGAVLANRVAAEEVIADAGQGQIVALRDTETGASWATRAGCVVAATGPWIRELLGEAAPRMRLVKGVHLVLPGIPDCHSAFLLTAPQDGRVFFVIPWYGCTLLGTTESEVSSPAAAEATDAETAYLLAAAQAWLPGLNWSPQRVLSRFAGVRALQAERTDNLSAVTREFSIERPRAGLIVPVGGKFTTARHDAERIVDAAQKELGRRVTPSETAARLLPGAPSGALGPWHHDSSAALQAAGVHAAAAAQVALRHGTRCLALLKLLQENPGWARPLHPQAPFIKAEAVLALREEMARDADDVLRRRLPLQLLAGADAGRADVEALLRDAS